jgi:hypothetical protein
MSATTFTISYFVTEDGADGQLWPSGPQIFLFASQLRRCAPRCNPYDSSRLVTIIPERHDGARCVRGLGSRTAPKDAA